MGGAQRMAPALKNVICSKNTTFYCDWENFRHKIPPLPLQRGVSGRCRKGKVLDGTRT